MCPQNRIFIIKQKLNDREKYNKSLPIMKWTHFDCFNKKDKIPTSICSNLVRKEKAKLCNSRWRLVLRFLFNNGEERFTLYSLFLLQLVQLLSQHILVPLPQSAQHSTNECDGKYSAPQ